jgi:hypothetical protein
MILPKCALFQTDLKLPAAIAVICHRGLASCPKTSFAFHNAAAHADAANSGLCMLSAIKGRQTLAGTPPAYGDVDADEGNRGLDARASSERCERCGSASFI